MLIFNKCCIIRKGGADEGFFSQFFFPDLRRMIIRYIVVFEIFYCTAFSQEDFDAYWEMYKNHYKKQYSGKEDSIRRNILRNNIKMINNHNVRHDLGLVSYRLKVNKFADMVVTFQC